MNSEPVGIGIIGAGVISGQYLENLVRMPGLRVLWVADGDPVRSRARAEQFGVPNHGSVEQLLADPRVVVVVNLTVPQLHVEVALRAVAAGKHVWGEKPFSLDRESGLKLLDAAEKAGVRVASAPDTIFGQASQTARRVVESGVIGTPLTGLAVFQTAGPESWHPSPRFLYAKGGGPLFDVGPYYLSNLFQIFGPVDSVAATSSTAHSRRRIGSGPKAGTYFPVEVPTQVAALLRFEGGGSAQTIFSFDSAKTRAGIVEITGTSGTAVFPDPNDFASSVEVWRPGTDTPDIIDSPPSSWSRGIGVAELVEAIREGRPERANGRMAFHLVDVMLAISEAAESGTTIDVASTFEPGPLLPREWDPASV